MPPVKVEIMTIKSKEVSPVLNLEGELTAASRHELSFLVPGKITRLFVKEGDEVLKGQLLAKLESADYNQAVLIAEAKLEEANDQYQRLANMYASGSLPEADFNKIKALKQEAEANYELYKNKRSYTELNAEVTGSISRIWAREGMAVDEGQPVITLLNTGEFLAKIGVPEKSITTIRLGSLAKVIVPATGDTLRGEVEKMSPSASKISRTYDLDLTLTESTGALRDGMLCEVFLTEYASSMEILIPAGLIHTDVNGIHYVFLAEGQVAKRRRVVPGKLVGNDLLIERGLSAGDKLILNPPIDLMDGASIIF